jgi:hypothetical protein
MKVGDGVTVWHLLPYIIGVSGYSGYSGFSGVSGYSGSGLTAKNLLTNAIAPVAFIGSPLVSAYNVTSIMSGEISTTSAGVTEGVIVDAPHNICILRDIMTGNPIADVDGNEYYGRISESAGVWTLNTYVLASGIETLLPVPIPLTIQFAVVKRFDISNVPEDATRPFWPNTRPSAYDLNQDVRIDRAYQWDRVGDSVKPRNSNDAVKLVGASTTPTTPEPGAVKTYVTVSGTSPNKIVRVCQMGEDGIETVISTNIV